MTDVDAMDAIFADLGSGDDTLNITASSAAEAILNGGTHWGGDSLSESGNTFRTASRGGWERSTRR